MSAPPRFVVHVGYPKTATTTLQVALQKKDAPIHYLGKFIPSHRYCDERLHALMETLITGFETDWVGARGPLADLLRTWQGLAGERPSVVSYENFLHPWATEPSLVARRLFQVAPHAQILMVIREQVSLLQSFYRWHGGFGQYLFLNKYFDEACQLPLSPDEWLHYQFRFPTKNMIGYIDYDAILEAYEYEFGKVNVHVLLYEDFIGDFGLYARQLADVLGIKKDACARMLKGVRANSEGDGLKLPEAPRTPLSGTFSSEGADRIRAAFATSNQRLAARRGLDLAKRGYALPALA